MSFSAYAQSLDFGGGYTENGFAGNFDYNIYLSNDSYVQIGLNALFAKTKFVTETKSFEIPYSNYLLNAGYFLPLLENASQTMQFSAGGGLSLGYEAVGKNNNMPEGISIQSTSSFIYGGLLSGELNVSVAKNLLVLLKFNQYYHLNSNVGNMSMYAGAGIRFYIE